MIKINQELNHILSMKPAIIGIGNELRGDDAAGILLVQKIQNSGYQNSIIVYSTPENYLNKIAKIRCDARLWIDVINWGARPGAYKIFDVDEIGQYAISTHNFSPIVLVDYLNSLRYIPNYFLGIQPQKMGLGDKISTPVRDTITKIATFIIDHTK
jgi:hydrogenase 3 maturation protease